MRRKIVFIVTLLFIYRCIFYLKIFWFITIPLPSPCPTLRSGPYSGNVDNWDSRAPKSPKTDVRLNKSLIKRIIKTNFCSRRNYRGSSCVFFFYHYNFLWEKIEANSFDKLTKFIIYNNWLWHLSTLSFATLTSWKHSTNWPIFCKTTTDKPISLFLGFIYASFYLFN